jgi:hypothetical protein
MLLWVHGAQRGLVCVCAVLDLVPTAELRVKKGGGRTWETVYHYLVLVPPLRQGQD